MTTADKQAKAGDWYILDDVTGEELAVTIYDAAGTDGDGPHGHGRVCTGAVLQDARLISAAPDMYLALQEIYGIIKNDLFDMWINRSQEPNHVKIMRDLITPAMIRAQSAIARAQSECIDEGRRS
jgi:hypothetical protein|tara:strand:+ start:439 stop:813 length:375 start_codon:yes stop_codon:yes gene_type:complete